MQSHPDLSVLQLLKSSLTGVGRPCKYKGKTYKDGQSMPCGDGCNTRVCRNGQPGGCTEKFCITTGKGDIVKPLT